MAGKQVTRKRSQQRHRSGGVAERDVVVAGDAPYPGLHQRGLKRPVDSKDQRQRERKRNRRNVRLVIDNHAGEDHRGPEHHVAGQVDIFKARQPCQQQINSEACGNGDSHAAAKPLAKAGLPHDVGQANLLQPKHFGPDGLEYQQR